MVDDGSRVGSEGAEASDPTALTTDQLLREIARLEKLMESQVSGLAALMEEKIAKLSEQTKWSKELREEEFNSVNTQFALIERQRVEQKKDTKDAVDAALAAAKEAVKEQTTASDRSITKSETATSEQLKQLNVTFTTAISGQADVISDVKERVSRIETLKQGGKENVTSLYAFAGFLVTLLILGGGIAAILAGR